MREHYKDMGDGTWVVQWDYLDELIQFSVNVENVRVQVIFPPAMIRVNQAGKIITDNCKFRREFGLGDYNGS